MKNGSSHLIYQFYIPDIPLIHTVVKMVDSNKRRTWTHCRSGTFFRTSAENKACIKIRKLSPELWVGARSSASGLDLTTRDSWFTILVEVFTNHILAKNTFLTNHIERPEHKITILKSANKYQISQQCHSFKKHHLFFCWVEIL